MRDTQKKHRTLKQRLALFVSLALMFQLVLTVPVVAFAQGEEPNGDSGNNLTTFAATGNNPVVYANLEGDDDDSVAPPVGDDDDDVIGDDDDDVIGDDDDDVIGDDDDDVIGDDDDDVISNGGLVDGDLGEGDLVDGDFVFNLLSAPAGPDATSLLTRNDYYNIELYQGSSPDPIAPGGTLINDDFRVAVTIPWVPILFDGKAAATLGDTALLSRWEENGYVSPGDEARFILLRNCGLLDFDGSKKEELWAKVSTGAEYHIGNVTFTKVGTDLVAYVKFDGPHAGAVMGEGNNAFYGLSCEFSASIKFSAGSNITGEAAIDIATLQKEYKLELPTAPENKAGIKKYVLNGTTPVDDTRTIATMNPANRIVTWEVVVTAPDGEFLKGYTFSDDLSAVGSYVDNSFEIEDVVGATPSATVPALTYTFGDDFAAVTTATIKFQTKIFDKDYFASNDANGNKTVTITNTAALSKTGKTTVYDNAKVTFERNWIRKSGTAGNIGTQTNYNPTDRTITWKIYANETGETLSGATIKDIVPAGLKVDLSKSTLKFGAAGTPIPLNTLAGFTVTANSTESFSGANRDLVIAFTNDLTTSVEISLFTTVADPADGYVYKGESYDNTATIEWGTDYKDKATANVGVGLTSITKSGTLNTPNGSYDGTVTWNVKAMPKGQEALKGTAVYDLIVVDGAKPAENKWTIDNTVWAGLKANIYQELVGDPATAVSTDANCKATVTKLEDGGKTVAYLIKVEPNSADYAGEYSFSFKTKVTKPEIVLEAGSVTNYAQLYKAGFLSDAHDTKTFPENMFKKDALKAGTTDTAGTAGNAYNYETNSVTYRLHVNQNSVDMSAVGAGSATVTDVLPLGWEFKAYDGALVYKIYNAAGTALTAQQITDAGIVPGAVVEGSDAVRESITFTFANLKVPYLIELNAGPTADQAASYFGENNTWSGIWNDATLTYTGGKIESKQDVTIVSKIIDKKAEDNERAPGHVAGKLAWTLEYNPYKLEVEGDYIVDTLTGNQQYETENGELVFTAYELTLNAAKEVTGKTEVNYIEATVASDGKSVTFKGFEAKKAYQLVYNTLLTGEKGDTVGNEAVLWRGEQPGQSTQDSYEISKTDAAARINLGGWLDITKYDAVEGHTAVLAGAKFELYPVNSDGTTGDKAYRSGTTDDKGKLVMYILPVGNYVLKEVGQPDGYRWTPNAYSVTVEIGIDGLPKTTVADYFGSEPNAFFVPNSATKDFSTLQIEKTVSGDDGDRLNSFDFKIKFFDPETKEQLQGPFLYEKTDAKKVTETGSVTGTGSFELADKENIRFYDLPRGAIFEVTELDSREHRITVKDQDGKILVDGSGEVEEFDETAGSDGVTSEKDQIITFNNHKQKPGSSGGDDDDDDDDVNPGDDDDDDVIGDDDDDDVIGDDDDDVIGDDDDDDDDTDIPPTPSPTGDFEPYIVYDEEGTPLGTWRFDPETEEWIFEEAIPLGAMLPQTGDPAQMALWATLMVAALGTAGVLALWNPTKRKEKK